MCCLNNWAMGRELSFWVIRRNPVCLRISIEPQECTWRLHHQVQGATQYCRVKKYSEKNNGLEVSEVFVLIWTSSQIQSHQFYLVYFMHKITKFPRKSRLVSSKLIDRISMVIEDSMIQLLMMGLFGLLNWFCFLSWIFFLWGGFWFLGFGWSWEK